MKIKFSSEDDLPPNKTPELHNMIILVRSVSDKDSKHYLQGFLDECFV